MSAVQWDEDREKYFPRLLRFVVRRSAPSISYSLRCDKFIFGKDFLLENFLRDWKPEPGDFPEKMTCLLISTDLIDPDDVSAPIPRPLDHTCTLTVKRPPHTPEVVCVEWSPATAECLISSLARTLDKLKKLFPVPHAHDIPFELDQFKDAVRQLCALYVFPNHILNTLFGVPSVKAMLASRVQSQHKLVARLFID